MPVDSHEVSSIILSCPTKSSPLDPIPTIVLKECLASLAPSITNILNLSLTPGVFPEQMKLAFVTALLKKQGLDHELLSNYRPVSLFSLVSKLLERVVDRQLVTYLEERSLFVEV